MGARPNTVVTGASWSELTYQIIGLAMALHNELGPGHRESVYHNGMVIKLQSAGRSFESEPYVPVTLADGTVVKGQCPDLFVEQLVVVELKAHVYTMSRDEQAQVIGYFAALPESPVALVSQLRPASVGDPPAVSADDGAGISSREVGNSSRDVDSRQQRMETDKRIDGGQRRDYPFIRWYVPIAQRPVL